MNSTVKRLVDPADVTDEKGAAPWSAHNLPKAKVSGTLRFSLVGAAAGLVAIVLATTVMKPIGTAGTQMEPARFTASAKNRQDTTVRSSAPKAIVMSSIPQGR